MPILRVRSKGNARFGELGFADIKIKVIRASGPVSGGVFAPSEKSRGFAGNWKLDYCAADSTKKRCLSKKKARHLVSKVPGAILATTYSRTTYRCTTIGSAAFHFRVRNGNGWCHCAGSPDDDDSTSRIPRCLVTPRIFLIKNNRSLRPQAPKPLWFSDIRTLGERLQLHQQQDCKMEKKAERALVSLS